MNNQITAVDIEVFQRGEMILKPPVGAESQEILRGRIRKVSCKEISLLQEGEAELKCIQTISILFGWIVEERTVQKNPTEKKIRRKLKCFGYLLENLDVDIASIIRTRSYLKFQTIAGETGIWLSKDHVDTLKRETLKRLLKEHRES